MVARIPLLSLALLLSFSIPALGIAAPQKPLAVCVDNQTGSTSVKAKCNPKRETRFVPADVRTLGGSGLNVYDSTGHVVGPFLGIDKTIVDIGGNKYWTTFTEEAIGGRASTVFFTGADCTGDAYTRRSTDMVHYAGIGSLGVSLNNDAIITTATAVGDVPYVSHMVSGVPPCINGERNLFPSPLTGATYQVRYLGPISQYFHPPFDVR